MANLVYYPYQLENGNYIDKISGKTIIKSGTIDLYPVNITPYKTPKNYLGGGGMYKTSNTQGSFIYTNWNIFSGLTDFTIFYWAYKLGGGGAIFTSDDSGGGAGFGTSTSSFYYNHGDSILGYHNSNTSNWAFYEFTFKKSGSNYFITCFYNGTKQYSGNVSSYYIIHTTTFLGTWSYAPRYYANGFNGYIYDFSMYDEILHTVNYTKLPYKEMNPGNRLDYLGMQNENNLYGMI